MKIYVNIIHKLVFVFGENLKMRLFVIGNGFDLGHDLPTSYINFREYLQKNHPYFLECLENMYNIMNESTVENLNHMYDIDMKSITEMQEQYLWKEFEKNLGFADDDEMIYGGMQLVEDLGLEAGDIGIEDTLDSYWEGKYRFIRKLNEYIKSWIKQIDIDVRRKTNIIERDRDDIFLSFNYTLLLEEVYKIDRKKVLHIHGSIDGWSEPPVIGHGEIDKINELKERAKQAAINFDEKESSIYNAVGTYYSRTFKDVKGYISSNSVFFDKLKDVREVSIIGHSLGDVDMPYFQEIEKVINKEVIWNIYYFSKNEKLKLMDKIKSLGIKEDNIRMLETNDFYNLNC